MALQQFKSLAKITLLQTRLYHGEGLSGIKSIGVGMGGAQGAGAPP
jgi:hypothetical protein